MMCAQAFETSKSHSISAHREANRVTARVRPKVLGKTVGAFAPKQLSRVSRIRSAPQPGQTATQSS